MKINGKDIGEWQVVTKSLEEFNKAFNKLRELGFVYASERLKTCDEINRNFGWYATIIIGNDHICKAVLHGRNFPRTNIPVVTLEDFIENYYSAYWAA